jgi:hypothetical protein
MRQSLRVSLTPGIRNWHQDEVVSAIGRLTSVASFRRAGAVIEVDTVSQDAISDFIASVSRIPGVERVETPDIMANLTGAVSRLRSALSLA